MSKKIILITAIIFLITLSNCVLAGTTGKIAGYLKDKDTGEPLIGANVLIEGTTRGTSTDEDGYYSIINLQPGQYDLIYRFIGYTTVKIENIEVSVDRTTRVDVELSVETVGLNEIVVNSSRPPIQKDRTYSASIVNSKTIESMPVTSIGEVIALQPGVVNAGGTLHFRGGRSREVAYLIDGIPVTNSFDQGGGNNVVVENSVVQELEVISGTFNAEYGAAQSGIVNIITKGISDKTSGSLNFYAGEWYSSNNDIFIGLDEIDPVNEKDLQFSLSGPILRDMLSYSVSGRVNSSSSLQWYEKRYNSIDGWRIAAYQRWFQEQNPNELTSSQGINIPDSLKTGDLSTGPLSTYDSYSMNAKINFAPISQVIIGYQVFGSYSESIGSTSSYRRYQPDNMSTYRSWSHHHFLNIKHSPSDKIFYGIGFSYQFNDGESFFRKDNRISQFPGDEGIQPISASADGFSLGDTDGFFSDSDGKNFREQIIVNGNFNWQLGKYNFIKAGFEYKKHQVNTYYWGYVETKDWETKKWLNFDPDPSLTFDQYWNIMSDYWSTWEETFDTTKYRKFTEDEYANWRDYTISPSEFAAYLQDKVELGELILNIGVRMDVFMPNERVPINYRTESFLLGSEQNLKDASTKFQISPRLGVSFPISDRGVFHAAYGHFFQMPSFSKMFNEPLYVVTPIQLEGRRLGNADLEPESTVQYEIGLQQQITDDIAVDITAYYKNIKNLLGIESVTTTDAVGYTRFINRDYGDVKGITFGLRKNSGMINGALNYSFSYANGSSSSPEELALVQAATQIGGEPFQFVDRKILPLDWDQRHTLNLIVNITQPNDWTVGFVGFLNSGLPYSPTFIERFDILEREYKNRASKPLRWSIDLKAKKFFTLGPVNYAVFVKIDNLFDNLNQNDVYSASGSADQPVRLPETEELEKERLLQEGHFTLSEIDNRPEWYSSPRRIQFGVEIFF